LTTENRDHRQLPLSGFERPLVEASAECFPERADDLQSATEFPEAGYFARNFQKLPRRESKTQSMPE
jgi:hypothetical protein